MSRFSRDSVLNCHATIIMVTTVAKRSEVGNDAHTPLSPYMRGSVSNSGIRKITWRIRLRNIDFPALPIDWNRVVETIWKPTTQNASSDMCSELTVAAISSLSVVKAIAMMSGNSIPTAAPVEVTTVPASVESQNARLSRWRSPAP